MLTAQPPKHLSEINRLKEEIHRLQSILNTTNYSDIVTLTEQLRISSTQLRKVSSRNLELKSRVQELEGELYNVMFDKNVTTGGNHDSNVSFVDSHTGVENKTEDTKSERKVRFSADVQELSSSKVEKKRLMSPEDLLEESFDSVEIAQLPEFSELQNVLLANNILPNSDPQCLYNRIFDSVALVLRDSLSSHKKVIKELLNEQKDLLSTNNPTVSRRSTDQEQENVISAANILSSDTANPDIRTAKSSKLKKYSFASLISSFSFGVILMIICMSIVNRRSA